MSNITNKQDIEFDPTLHGTAVIKEINRLAGHATHGEEETRSFWEVSRSIFGAASLRSLLLSIIHEIDEQVSWYAAEFPE